MEDDYSDDDEPFDTATVQDVKAEPGKGIVLTISNEALANIASAVAGELVERFERRMTKTVNDRIDKAVKAAIETKIADVMGGRVEALVTTLIEKPRQRTDSWGNPTGPAVAFVDQIPAIVENHLNIKVDDKGNPSSYSDNKKTRLGWLLATMVRDQLDQETRKAADLVTQKGREIVTQHLAKFVAEQLVPAIELKPTPKV